jgi:hypothetical protein
VSYPSPTIPASGITFAGAQKAGPTGHLELLIAGLLTAITDPPTAPTLAASGTGNTLPAATYYVVQTETNGIGETRPSPVSTGQAVTLGQLLTITPHAFQSGSTACNLYVGTAAVGPFTLAVSGHSVSAVNITAPLPSNSYAVNPPAYNSTGLLAIPPGGNLNYKMAALRAVEKGRIQDVYANLKALYGKFMGGDPVNFADAVHDLRRAHTTFAALAVLCAELGTLIDANPGTIANVATPIGGMKAVRTWP